MSKADDALAVRKAALIRRGREAGLEKNRVITKAELLKVGGSVRVSGRPGYVWAKEFGEHGGVFQVFNVKTTAWAGLPVLISSSPKPPARRQVEDVNWELIAASSNFDGNPYLPEHGQTHIRYDGYHGPDAVDLYPRMVFPLRCEAATGLTVDVMPFVYLVAGARVYYPGVSGLDLSSYVPTTSGKARKVLVYLDTADNTAKVVAGALGSSATGVALSYPPVPSSGIGSAWVRLAYGYTSLSEATDFEEARMIVSGQQTGTGQAANTLPCCGA